MITPSLRLVRQLGTGGMGSVWIADNLALQAQVVVKFMRADLAYDQALLRRFREEAAAAAAVKSPHVVQVFDHGVTASGEPYIVMELLEGSDLGDVLAARGPLPLQTVAEIVSQVCKALSRAHERGIVHRDIKPQNIFLCRGDADEIFVKVLDFGIAKRSVLGNAASGTLTGSLLGTPYYMSPEQMMDAKSVDLRADLWALGVVAFECMTGRRPFDSDTVGALAVAVCKDPIVVPSSVHRGLSPAIDAWFARACSRDLGARFASAKAMADALHDALARPGPAQASLGSDATVGLDSAATVFPTAANPAPSYAAPQPPSPQPTSPNAAQTYLPTTYPVLAPNAANPRTATTHAPTTDYAPSPPSEGGASRRGSWLVLVLAVVVFAAGGTIFLLAHWLNVAAGPGPSAAASASAPAPPPPPAASSASMVVPFSPPETAVSTPTPRASAPPPRASTSASARPAHSFDRNAIE